MYKLVTNYIPILFSQVTVDWHGYQLFRTHQVTLSLARASNLEQYHSRHNFPAIQGRIRHQV